MPQGQRSTRASRKARQTKDVPLVRESYPNAKDGWEPSSQSIRIPRVRAIVLDILRRGGSWQLASDEAEVSRKSLKKWYDEDAEFREECDDAIEGGTDRLEDEAVRRGQRGYRKAVYHQGVVVGYERVYSDTLLTLNLKARRKDKFRENASIEHAGPGGGPIQTQQVSLTKEQLIEEARKRGLPVEIFDK